jgi:hypothetical protein
MILFDIIQYRGPQSDVGTKLSRDATSVNCITGTWESRRRYVL